MARFSPDTLPEANLDSRPTEGAPLLAPHPDTFARYPQSWHFVCASAALPAGAKTAVNLHDHRVVVFRSATGHASAVAARCPHMGSDLADGRVVGETIECPYHRFRYDGTGRCWQNDLTVRAYATAERCGAVFVYLGARPRFPFPTLPADLVSARPLRWTLDTQWFMVGANAFDARHFRTAHGRRLLSPPTLDHPGRLAMRVSYEYEIESAAWVDRAVRLFSGARVQFNVTSWCGNVLLVQAKFRNDASFGVVVAEPRGGARFSTDVTVIVSAKRRNGLLAPAANWLRLLAKRVAIKHMLRDDFTSLRRLDYVHDGLRSGDEVLAQYLRWVRVVAPNADEITD